MDFSLPTWQSKDIGDVQIRDCPVDAGQDPALVVPRAEEKSATLDFFGSGALKSAVARIHNQLTPELRRLLRANEGEYGNSLGFLFCNGGTQEYLRTGFNGRTEAVPIESYNAGIRLPVVPDSTIPNSISKRGGPGGVSVSVEDNNTVLVFVSSKTVQGLSGKVAAIAAEANEAFRKLRAAGVAIDVQSAEDAENVADTHLVRAEQNGTNHDLTSFGAEWLEAATDRERAGAGAEAWRESFLGSKQSVSSGATASLGQAGITKKLRE